MSFPPYLKYIGLTLLFGVAAVNFTRTTLSVIESSKRLEELRGHVGGLEAEKATLEQEVEYRQTEGFVEEEARDKLGLVKPGEELFVVKEVLGELTRREAPEIDPAHLTIPQAWIDLFGLL